MCYQSILLALALVVGIIYLFLGNIRAMIVPAITLPVSLIGAALGLWIFGLTINIFTLLAIILSVAIVTDDSVVMTESIYHRIEQGDSPLVAAATGSKNVIFAILSTSIIILATFTPLLFISGISGTLFREMAVALSIAVVISTFTALSIAPMLGSKLLSKKTNRAGIVLKSDHLRLVARQHVFSNHFSSKAIGEDVNGSIRIVKEGLRDGAHSKTDGTGASLISLESDGTVMIDGATVVIGTGRETSNGKGDHIFLGAGATEPIVLGKYLVYKYEMNLI